MHFTSNDINHISTGDHSKRQGRQGRQGCQGRQGRQDRAHFDCEHIVKVTRMANVTLAMEIA